MKIIVIFLLVVTNIHATEINPIKKGDPSPIDGYVIDVSTEKAMRSKMDKLEYQALKLEWLGVAKDAVIDAQKDHIELQKRHNLELRDELTKSTGFWTKAAWFTLGSVMTGLISYGVIKGLRN